MKKSLIITVFIFSALLSMANTIVVINTNNSGIGSFRQAIATANNGDTIRFNASLLTNGNDTIKLLTNLNIEKRIVVKGLFTASDTLFISGQNLTRILSVGFPLGFIGKRNVTLDSLILINGNAGTANGAGIFASSQLDTLFLKNSFIGGCQANSGGGLYCGPLANATDLPPMVRIENTTFKSNSATDYGGAMATVFAKTLCVNATFKENTSQQLGGSIYYSANAPSEIFYTNFSNNSATTHGGGIFCRFNATVFVKGATFYNNESAERGGAIYASGIVGISKTVIDSNVAGTRGGGVYFASGSGAMSVDSSTISRNMATTWGGGICVHTNVSISTTSFQNNTSAFGAGLYMDNSTVNILGATFTNNSSTLGGGIYNGVSGILNINKSTLVNNSASSGGGIYCELPFDQAIFNLENSTIYNNTATLGGGVYFGFSYAYSLNADLKSSIVAGNGNSNFYIADTTDTITSFGNNFFSNPQVSGAISTDHLNISDSLLSLRGIGYYGGFTQTIPPNIGSVVINAGNPLDASPAQNRTIIGVRDAGAAEGIGVYQDTILACTQFTWYGNVYTNTGNYAHTINTNGNIDTVALLNLTIIQPVYGVDVISSCVAYTWIDGIKYMSSNNTATFTLPSATGCDSIVTLNLTIAPPVTSTVTFTACESFTWSNGITYTSSTNTATDTLLTVGNCDSVVFLNLTILMATSHVDAIVACDSYTWINGITYTGNNNTATDTLVNAVGCDSVVTLNLVIQSGLTGIDTIMACGSYTWIDGVTYTTNNNTAFDTIPSSAGCDSVVTLNLTIKTVNVAVTVTEPNITAQAASASYRWLNCDANFAIIQGATSQNFSPAANGNYAVEITDQGCVDTSACVAIKTIGVDESIIHPEILVYPNPARHSLFLGQLWYGEAKRISLINAIGQELFITTSTESEVEINVSNLADGVYTLRVVSDSRSFTKKIVITKN